MKRVYSAVLTVFFAINCFSAQAITISLPEMPSLPWKEVAVTLWVGDKVASGFDMAEEGLRSGISKYWHYPITIPASFALQASRFTFNHPTMISTIIAGVAAEATVRHFAQFWLLERWLNKSLAYSTGNESIGKKYFRFATWRCNDWKLGYDIGQNPAEACQQLWLDINGLEDKSRIDIKHNGRSVTPGSVLWAEILQALQDETKEFEGMLAHLENFTVVPTMIYDKCIADHMSEAEVEFEPTGTCVQFLNAKNQQDLDMFENVIYNAYENMSSTKKVTSNIVSLRFWRYPWNTRIMTWHTRASNLYWSIYRHYLRLRALKDVVEGYIQRNASNNHAQVLWHELAGLKALVNRMITSKLYLSHRSKDKQALIGQIQETIRILKDKNSERASGDDLNAIENDLEVLTNNEIDGDAALQALGGVNAKITSLMNKYRNYSNN